MTQGKTSTPERATCATYCRNTTTIWRWPSPPTTRDQTKSSCTAACRPLRKPYRTCAASSAAMRKANQKHPRSRRLRPELEPWLLLHRLERASLNRNYYCGFCGGGCGVCGGFCGGVCSLLAAVLRCD